MKIVSRLGLSGLATAAALAVAGPAAASAYYSASSPLKAYQDGVVQAQMYGRFSVEQLTYLRNDTTQRDARPGGDYVFERTEYWYDNADDGSFVKRSTDQGPKTSSGTWYSQYDHDPFDIEAGRGRMRTHICEDHGILPDPCSVWPQQTFNL